MVIMMATVAIGLPRVFTRYPYVGFVVRRIGAGLLTLLVVSALIFAGTEVLPGDAASAVLGRYATPDALATLRHEMHLDRPAVVRYVSWLAGIVHGDAAGRLAGTDHSHGARRDDRGAALRLCRDGAAERVRRAAGGVALRPAQRARADRAGDRAERAMADRRHRRHRVRLWISGPGAGSGPGGLG